MANKKSSKKTLRNQVVITLSFALINILLFATQVSPSNVFAFNSHYRYFPWLIRFWSSHESISLQQEVNRRIRPMGWHWVFLMPLVAELLRKNSGPAFWDLKPSKSGRVAGCIQNATIDRHKIAQLAPGRILVNLNFSLNLNKLYATFMPIRSHPEGIEIAGG